MHIKDYWTNKGKDTETVPLSNEVHAIVSSYDAIGNETETNLMGNETLFSYTALVKIESVTNAKGEKQTYCYYPGGLLTTATRANYECENQG